MRCSETEKDETLTLPELSQCPALELCEAPHAVLLEQSHRSTSHAALPTQPKTPVPNISWPPAWACLSLELILNLLLSAADIPPPAHRSASLMHCLQAATHCNSDAASS